MTDADGNDVTDQFTVNIDDAKLTIVEGDSDKSASNLPHTGDSAPPLRDGHLRRGDHCRCRGIRRPQEGQQQALAAHYPRSLFIQTP